MQTEIKIGMIITRGGKKYLVQKVNKKTIKMIEVAMKKKGNMVSLTFGDRYEMDKH